LTVFCFEKIGEVTSPFRPLMGKRFLIRILGLLE